VFLIKDIIASQHGAYLSIMSTVSYARCTTTTSYYTSVCLSESYYTDTIQFHARPYCPTVRYHPIPCHEILCYTMFCILQILHYHHQHQSSSCGRYRTEYFWVKIPPGNIPWKTKKCYKSWMATRCRGSCSISTLQYKHMFDDELL